MRIVDCGLRIAGVSALRHDLARQFRNPKSAIPNLLLLLAACTPVTTRPDFAPYPEALHVVINVRPAQVTTEAQTWLAAESIAVQHASPVDGFLETRWVQVTDSAGQRMRVKVRLWADPDVPGKSRVTVEAVYVPFHDPSRAARDLERAAPAESAGQQLAKRLVAALSEKLGVTTY